jgi:hypothetical protein
MQKRRIGAPRRDLKSFTGRMSNRSASREKPEEAEPSMPNKFKRI